MTLVINPMSKPDAEPAQPTSETVRVSGDLMEMLRELCFHSKDTRGKRTKMTQMVDTILRPAVTEAYRKLQEELAKPKPKAKPSRSADTPKE